MRLPVVNVDLKNEPLSSPSNIQLWTILKYIAQNAIGNPTANLTGFVAAATSGIHFPQAEGVLPAKKFGKIHNALTMQVAVPNGAHTLTGMTGWRILSGSLKKSYKKAGH